ncbi:MAG: UDP-N-acetylmuramate dehydrogenase [Actinomycetes bacterium]
MTGLPALSEHVALARFTTLGTGGPARLFARPESLDELVELLRYGREHGLPVEPIGLGSNLLVADAGVEAVVVRLAGSLASVDVVGSILTAGGGATNAVCLHRARASGLGGFEFASAIPGTAGAGVRMNAGAYGSNWAAVLLDAVVVDADGPRTVPVADLGLAYRHSNIAPGEIVASVRYQLVPRPEEEIKADVSRLLAQRKATQPTNKRTFGSVFKNPEHELGAGRLIEEVGLKGAEIGGACISQRHANFIENMGGATSSDVIALMAEARRRVADRFGVVLEHEVRLLGQIELPAL